MMAKNQVTPPTRVWFEGKNEGRKKNMKSTKDFRLTLVQIHLSIFMFFFFHYFFLSNQTHHIIAIFNATST
jgi:hypothetical protein